MTTIPRHEIQQVSSADDEIALILSSDSASATGDIPNDFVIRLANPLKIKHERAQLSMSTISLENSWSTIGPELSNNLLVLTDPINGVLNINLKSGQYEHADINKVIQPLLSTANAIQISADGVDGTTIFTILNPTWEVNLTASSPKLSSLLGWVIPVDLTATANSPEKANLGNDINALVLSCSLSSNITIGSLPTGTVTQIPIGIFAAPWNDFTWSPPSRDWVSVQPGTYSEIRITLTDQKGRLAPNFQLAPRSVVSVGLTLRLRK